MICEVVKSIFISCFFLCIFAFNRPITTRLLNAVDRQLQEVIFIELRPI